MEFRSQAAHLTIPSFFNPYQFNPVSQQDDEKQAFNKVK